MTSGQAVVALPVARPGRHAGIRVGLTLVACAQIVLLLAVVPGMTPVHLLVVGGFLALGAAAALVAVSLLGTTRPIGDSATGAIALLMVVSLLGAAIGPGITDPTQTGPADLELSATCSASPDLKTITATVAFRWLRTDLYPEGIAAPERGLSMLDRIALYPQDESSGLSSLLAPAYEPTPAPPYVATPSPDFERPAPPVGGIHGAITLPWTATSGPIDRTSNGRAGEFGFNSSAPPDSYVDPFGSGGLPGAMAVRASSLSSGTTYRATWRFAKVEPFPMQTADPVLLATYWHGDRFASQVLVPCTGPARPPVRFDERLGG